MHVGKRLKIIKNNFDEMLDLKNSGFFPFQISKYYGNILVTVFFFLFKYDSTYMPNLT
jgi:hypothetical protein